MMMNKEILLDKLSVFNDQDFKFDPDRHIYTYKGTCLTSATQFVGKFHKEFDQDYHSARKADILGIPQEQILEQWAANNNRANELGTAIHEWIENYFNRIWTPLPNDIELINRINKFNHAFIKWLYVLEPVVMELRVFSKIYPLAGTIDALFMYKDKIIILDWKSNKEFKKDGDRNFGNLLTPFGHLEDNHLNKYSIQLSVYKNILAEHGIDVSACYLLHIGPGDMVPEMYRAKDFTDILDTFLPEYNFF
jgi:hypothetical protein